MQTLSVKALINDDDRAGVVISSANNDNTVLEGGFTDKLKVVLTRQPTDNVTVHLASTNNQISLSDTSLVFTPSNWNTPAGSDDHGARRCGRRRLPHRLHHRDGQQRRRG